MEINREWLAPCGLYCGVCGIMIAHRDDNLKFKERLTQVQLSKMTGIPQRHISEIENGKRGIGKDRAKIFAEALKVDYRVFL